LPTLLGLVYAAWKLYRNLRRKEIALDVGRELVRVSLLSLAGSWLAWYLLLGMSYPRYLFPATFLGSMFASALIYEFTEGFSLSKTVMSASGAFLKGKFTGKALRSLLVVLMIAITVPFTLMALYFYYFVLPSSAATTVSEFVDQDLPGDAVIETYESELLFLSDHRWYHFPPDDVSVQMVSRNTYESDLGIDYDPLGADPDYLIQGPFSKQWHLYDDVLASQAFQLLFEASDYRVYQRVRKGARILH
jgi:hypothetical protein